MASSLCIEYQARAQGKSKTTRTWTDRQAILEQWEIKYKPCLNCEQGKEIAANGGKDDDVESLKQNHVTVGNEQTKYCPRCNNHLPKSAFGPHAGNKDGLQCYCRTCQRNIQNESSAKKRAAKSIDQIAPNIAPKNDNAAIETPSIAEKPIKNKHKDIASPMLNNDQRVNKANDITNDFPAPVSDDKGQVVAWTDHVFVCRKCGGVYTAAEWVKLEYVDDKTRVCKFSNCRGIVSMLAADQIHPGAKTETEEKPRLRTCTRCGYTGPEKHFHKAGVNGFIDVCRKCIVKKRVANKKDLEKNTVHLGPQDIVLSFVDYPEILDDLTSAAKKNFRTLANEILFRLVSHAR